MPTIDERGQAATIYIRPEVDTGRTAAIVLIHALLHLTSTNSHNWMFAEAMGKVGMNGSPLLMTPSKALDATLQTLLRTMPPYPGGGVKTLPEPAKAKQTTRMRRLSVDHGYADAEGKLARCTYAVRTTAKHIATGLPRCPHNVELKEDV